MQQHERQHDIQSIRHGGGGSALLHCGSEMKSPYVIEVEEECQDCGGSRYDYGSLSPIEPEECPACLGSGKQVTVHNYYLAEALRIAAGKSSMLAQREHLQAVIQHCRSLVGALMAISEIRSWEPEGR
jgi:hypothetical protein